MNPPPEWADGLHTEKAKREFLRQVSVNVSRSVEAWVHAMPWEWTGRELRQLLKDEWANETCGLQGRDGYRGALIKFRRELRSMWNNHDSKKKWLAKEPKTLIRKNRWAKNRNQSPRS